jgi:predicted nucleic acid-binding protein
MAFIIKVINQLTPAVATSFATNASAARLLMDPLIIPLTKAQTRGLLHVSAVREAQTKAIRSDIMIAFPATMPTGLTLEQFDALTQEQADTDAQQAHYASLAAELENHGMIIRNNRFVYATQALDNAGLLGKNNTTIAAADKLIRDTYYSKTSASGETDYTIALGGSATIGGVKTGKYLTNMGNTILLVINVNGNVLDTLTINPGSGKLIPLNWSNIVVTNKSTTEAGAFSVFMK